MAKRNAQIDDLLPTIDPADGTLDFFSVSSQKTFRLCPRAWWWDKKKGMPSKQTKGAKIGDECHGRVEHYMLTGEDVRGPIELAGADLLAPYFEQRRRDPESVEVEAALAPRLRTASGVILRGFTDLLVHPGASPWGDGLPEFVDHKFMRNFDYVPDENDLRDDGQGLGYAAWGLFVRWPGLTRVRFTHHQHAREGKDRKPRRVSVVHDLTHVRAAWEKTTREIDLHMTGVALLTDQEQVPVGDIEGDPETGKGSCCDAFGRCSYRSICSASPENRIAQRLLFLSDPSSQKEGPAVGLLDQVLNPEASQKQNPPAQPPPAQAATSSPPPAQVSAASGKLTAKSAQAGIKYNLPGGKVGEFVTLAGTFAVFTCADGSPNTIPVDSEISIVEPPKPAQPPPEPTFGPCELCETLLDMNNTSQLRSGNRVHVGCPGPRAAQAQTVNVGGAVLSSDAPASNPGAADVPTGPTKSKPADAEIIDQAARDSAAIADRLHAEQNKPEQAVQAGEGEKKPRGRGAKKPEPSAASTPPSLMQSTVWDFMLIVNASISHPLAQPLGPIIMATAAALSEAGKILDVRAAPKDHPLAYGAWKGALSAGVLAKLPPGIYTVESGDLADPVIEALSGKAVIVRGRYG
jgi:hypothetical protein